MGLYEDIHDTLGRYIHEADKSGDLPRINLSIYGGQSFVIGESVSPVKELAEREDMPEILGDYTRPKGIAFGEMQDYMVLLDESCGRGLISKQIYDDKINILWTELKQLNPELNHIEIDGKGINPMRAKRAAIIGVDDAYNVSDIQCFITQFMGGKAALNMNGRKTPAAQNYGVLSDEVKAITGNLRWRPSVETLSYMRDKLKGYSPSPDAIDAMHPGRRHPQQQPQSGWKPPAP